MAKKKAAKRKVIKLKKVVKRPKTFSFILKKPKSRKKIISGRKIHGKNSRIKIKSHKKKTPLQKKRLFKPEKKSIRGLKKPTIKKSFLKPARQEFAGNFSQEAQSFFKAKIKVIGIGGGGSSIVSEIGKSLHKAAFLVTDSDVRAKKKKPGIKRFLFGQNLTHGLGTGTNPELGRQAAEQKKEKIASFFHDQDIVILIASLGGGFGSGAAQVFADVARDFNGITFGIFTLPFKFEGKNKHAIALKSLKKLKNSLNVSLTISNEKIFNVIDNNVAITQAFSMVNKNLIDLIYNPGIINIDFADLRAILKTRGSLAFLNTAEGSGKDRANQVVEKILHNPLYQHTNFTAQKILFNIAGGQNLSLVEVNAISRAISDRNQNAKIIFGISKNPKLKNKIKATLLMTGPSASGAVAGPAEKTEKQPVKQTLSPNSKQPQKAGKKNLKKTLARKKKVKKTASHGFQKPVQKPTLAFPTAPLPVFA